MGARVGPRASTRNGSTAAQNGKARNLSPGGGSVAYATPTRSAGAAFTRLHLAQRIGIVTGFTLALFLVHHLGLPPVF